MPPGDSVIARLDCNLAEIFAFEAVSGLRDFRDFDRFVVIRAADSLDKHLVLIILSVS